MLRIFERKYIMTGFNQTMSDNPTTVNKCVWYTFVVKSPTAMPTSQRVNQSPKIASALTSNLVRNATEKRLSLVLPWL